MRMFMACLIVCLLSIVLLVSRLGHSVDKVEGILVNATSPEAQKNQQGIVLILLKEECRTQLLIVDPKTPADAFESQAASCAEARLAAAIKR